MRRRSRLADADALYRARMLSVGPDGVTRAWLEGPYPTRVQVQDRITYWKSDYARNRPEGWRVSGRLEVARLSWTGIDS